jgi:hypothetical protein
LNNAASRGVPIMSGREENGANVMVEGGMMTKWKCNVKWRNNAAYREKAKRNMSFCDSNIFDHCQVAY